MNAPLFDPLQTIGIDEAGIRRLFQNFSRDAISRWVKITDAAMHELPRGFSGFKVTAFRTIGCRPIGCTLTRSSRNESNGSATRPRSLPPSRHGSRPKIFGGQIAAPSIDDLRTHELLRKPFKPKMTLIKADYRCKSWEAILGEAYWMVELQNDN